MNVKNYLSRYYLYLKISSEVKKFIVSRWPEIEINRCYNSCCGKRPNLEDPKDLIEKICWMELHCDTSLWTKCTDKYSVRDYIKSKGLDSFLPELLGKWDNAKDIDLTKLPNEFVLKTNNGCETVYVVKDKRKEDWKAVRKKFNQWLKLPFGYHNAELHYSRIKPCIIAEELLHQSEEDQNFSPNSLIDYKIYSFRGKPECIWVAYDRTHEGVKMMLVDKDWNVLEDKMKLNNHYHYHSENKIPKPKCLEKMLEIASVLSEDFPEVRVDLYVIGGRPYIGELTFSSGFGFFTNEYYRFLGDQVVLPSKIK